MKNEKIIINMPPQFGRNQKHKIYIDDLINIKEKYYYAWERLFMIIKGIPKKYSRKNLFKFERVIYHPPIRINKLLTLKKLFFQLSTTISLFKITTRNKNLL